MSYAAVVTQALRYVSTLPEPTYLPPHLSLMIVLNDFGVSVAISLRAALNVSPTSSKGAFPCANEVHATCAVCFGTSQ